MKVGGVFAIFYLTLGATPPSWAYRIASEAEARARAEATRKIQTQGESVARKESEEFQKRASQARDSYTPYFAALLKRGAENPENLLKKAQEQERAYWDSEKNSIAREESERQRTLQRHAQDASSGVRNTIERGRGSPQKVARLIPSAATPKATSSKSASPRAAPRGSKALPPKRPPAPTYELDGSEIPQYLEFPGKKAN